MFAIVDFATVPRCQHDADLNARRSGSNSTCGLMFAFLTMWMSVFSSAVCIFH